jgi:hypothetical protein
VLSLCEIVSSYSQGQRWSVYCFTLFSLILCLRFCFICINHPSHTRRPLSQSYFTTGGLWPISWSWRHIPWNSRAAIFFQLHTYGYCPCVTSSLMSGWVCRLRSLLALASAVILRSESRGTHDHVLLSQIRDSPQPGEPGHHIYIPYGQSGPAIPPGTRVLKSFEVLSQKHFI